MQRILESETHPRQRVSRALGGLLPLVLAALVTVLTACDEPPAPADEATPITVDVAGGEYTTLAIVPATNLAPEGASISPLTASTSVSIAPTRPIAAGFHVDAGEILEVALFPTGSATGLTKLELVDPSGRVVSSRGPARDRVLRTHVPSAIAGRWTARVTCTTAPCAPAELFVSRGNESSYFGAFHATTYVNQRSFTDVLGCGGSAMGECLCAPSACADRLASMGIIDVSDIRPTTRALYELRTETGAADRLRIEAGLETRYGITCDQLLAGGMTFEQIMARLRAGQMVMFRSAQFSGAGHYVAVIGYVNLGGRRYLIVDDPYGSWRSSGSWSPANTTSATSTNGALRFYDAELLMGARADGTVLDGSAIACDLSAACTKGIGTACATTSTPTVPATPILSITCPASAQIGRPLACSYSAPATGSLVRGQVGTLGDPVGLLELISTTLPATTSGTIALEALKDYGLANVRICVDQGTTSWACSQPIAVIPASTTTTPPTTTVRHVRFEWTLPPTTSAYTAYVMAMTQTNASYGTWARVGGTTSNPATTHVVEFDVPLAATYWLYSATLDHAGDTDPSSAISWGSGVFRATVDGVARSVTTCATAGGSTLPCIAFAP